MWLSVWSKVQIVSIWSSWCYCTQKTPSLLASFKSRHVLPFWYRLTQVVVEKRPLNGGVCVFSIESPQNSASWQHHLRLCVESKDHFWTRSTDRSPQCGPRSGGLHMSRSSQCGQWSGGLHTSRSSQCGPWSGGLHTSRSSQCGPWSGGSPHEQWVSSFLMAHQLIMG